MFVNYEKKGRIGIITLNRPEVLNALNGPVYEEIHDAIADFANDPELWVGIITGTGDKAFSAGRDIKWIRESTVQQRANTPETQEGLGHIATWKPFIAAINGFCLGGGLEVALACDIRIAAEHAQLGLPEVLRGFIPGGVGPLVLPRILSWCHAAEILYTGKFISAQDAYRMGLVNKVVPLAQLMPTAMEWAESICQAAPLAVRAAKETMIRGFHMPLEEAAQLQHSFGLYTSQDFDEGTKAFLERRRPQWKAR